MNKRRKENLKPHKKKLKMGVIVVFFIIIIVIGVIYISLISKESPPSENIWGDAPDFTLKTIEGNDFTLSKQIGKVIVLDFMTSWCSWCVPQMVELEEVLLEKGNEIIIISVDIQKEETRDDLERVFGDYLEKWTFVIDNNEQNVGYKYQVSGIPKLVILDKYGNIYYSDSGLTQSEKIIEEINKANY
jgi:thiol-disulfide isomerase/thioredoxin